MECYNLYLVFDTNAAPSNYSKSGKRAALAAYESNA